MFFQAKPMIHLVVPGFKIFPFSMRESWSTLFNAKKISYKWIIHREGRGLKTSKALKNAKVVLLVNDHHLDDLTEVLLDQGHLGRSCDDRFWIGLSTEKVIGSVFPRSVVKTELCSKLCHLMAHFDPRAATTIQRAGAHPLFCHQYVDADTFRSRKKFEDKEKLLFWCGKLKVGNQANAYQERALLIETAKKIPFFRWREATNPEKSIKYIVREKDSYQGLLNLPSNCPGFTAAFFENVAMGACVLQYKVEGPQPRGLEPDVSYLSYNPAEPETLLQAAEKFYRSPAAFQESAKRAQMACLTLHTLCARAVEIFQAALSLAETTPQTDPEIRHALHNVLLKLKVSP